MRDTLPRFVTADDLYAQPDATDSVHGKSVGPLRTGRRTSPVAVGNDDGSPSILRSASPSDELDPRVGLGTALHEYLAGLRCDLETFDHVARRGGLDGARLDAEGVWSRREIYVTIVSALKSASASYDFDPMRRPPYVTDFREALRDRASVVEARHGAEARAMRRLALEFDPAYWTERDGPALTTDDVSRAFDLWQSFVGHAVGVVSWPERMALEMSVFELRRIADAVEAAIEPAQLVRRVLVRAAMTETRAVYAAHALATFLAANSEEFLRAATQLGEAKRR